MAVTMCIISNTGGLIGLIQDFNTLSVALIFGVMFNFKQLRTSPAFQAFGFNNCFTVQFKIVFQLYGTILLQLAMI